MAILNTLLWNKTSPWGTKRRDAVLQQMPNIWKGTAAIAASVHLEQTCWPTPSESVCACSEWSQLKPGWKACRDREPQNTIICHVAQFLLKAIVHTKVPKKQLLQTLLTFSPLHALQIAAWSGRTWRMSVADSFARRGYRHCSAIRQALWSQV